MTQNMPYRTNSMIESTPIAIAICHYPNALKSSIYGLEELFNVANRICREQEIACTFATEIIEAPQALQQYKQHQFQIAILPPSHIGHYYLTPESELVEWLKNQHQSGCVLASACAGAFILAHTQVLNQRSVTTHWGLVEAFQHHFPKQTLDSNQILIDHGDVLTAGGMMSWLDLGLELVAKNAGVSVLRQLGKTLVVDVAPRQQRYYQQFVPSMTHGDQAILSAQQQINLHFSRPITVSQLASQVHLSPRTLQRRFSQITGYSPNEYLQRLRIQKACDLLETTQYSFDQIAHLVGYQDNAACRKTFIKIMGLAPRAFRQRFMHSSVLAK